MATERLSMRKTREILRLKWCLGRSHREVSRSLGVSFGAVARTVSRAQEAGLGWPGVQGLNDEELERRLYPGEGGGGISRSRFLPDCAAIDLERRKPGVTLELLHLEYLEKHPDGYRYTQFCEIYRRWLKRRGLTMRQTHRAGEKLFVDYAGKKPHLVDPGTGECKDVELFVGALGASNFTYAEATLSQQEPDWIASHVRNLEFIGGAPGAIVPDQLKSGVTTPCRYEPGIQRTYEELAEHYGTVILPARPARPRDKAKAEVAVQIAERWIVARLRHETHFTLGSLNERIAELLEELNDRPMRRYGQSRRQMFEQLDRPALKPLPSKRFVYGEWKKARVNIDYHIEVDRHYYSVHHSLFQEQVEARVTSTTIEIFLRGQRVASHLRSYVYAGHTTLPEHMPKAHQKHLEWTPSRIIGWAATIGPETQGLVQAILADRPHPEQGYRSCLGILRLARRYGDSRLEAAASRALAAGARSYRHVDSILKHGLDRLRPPLPLLAQASPAIEHENVRGREYYR
ncbi:IS21 family transposase [Patescibacteria group bacterium]|nr:IS21 family transposase [Patescibacteria group bacterium]